MQVEFVKCVQVLRQKENTAHEEKKKIVEYKVVIINGVKNAKDKKNNNNINRITSVCGKDRKCYNASYSSKRCLYIPKNYQ